ncbi:SDR family NAD(P)-dependent oxidoreductase [Okeania hirsuta]|uniref:SDR family NAD(P)-dependent oxidoreductase n=1 Tax=Okeania hirsuta TaxID=1458930 RepID=A0A3N6QP84_9CYAN|nr:type I polyketide synthase [Okeania hirsuta]RQH48212.1 SDR family NAD(P)-dependent oxidoreductase [Okeania hirsuta]
MMQSLGWLSKNEVGEYSLTENSQAYLSIPEKILDLYNLPIESYLLGKEKPSILKSWIELSQQQWHINDITIADFLDGVLIIPIMLALHKHNLLAVDQEEKPLFSGVSPHIREELSTLFIAKGWAEKSSITVQKHSQKSNDYENNLCLTALGKFIVERILITGVTASYTPMLLQISDVLFGKSQTVFCRDEQGSESHIDRKLNVMSNGFQHQKFFADVDELILSIFNQLPYYEQPNYIVDMGCGDGTLLKRVYQVISTKSARGKVLDKYPVQMIGVDYNQASLQESALTLAGIPNLLMKGDIGNPQQMISDLRTHGIDEPEKILHIRSFLDHDRPFIPPQNLEAAKKRSQLSYSGVYVDSDGGLIPAQIMIQSLVEHLERWSSVVTKNGMMILEVHCLEPEVVNKFLDSSNNLHFDALQAFSSQHLVEADVFLSCAAEVGLFPKWEFSKRYPQNFPFSRITLNCFEKKPYKLRHPTIKDLPELIVLEELCWSENLRVDSEEIQRRILNFPQGQFVLELEDKIVGAIYSQRIERTEVLENRTFVEVPSLHTESGVVIQLLATNILPELQNQGLGDQLLEWMLQYCAVMGGVERVVGVTRCRNYPDYSPIPMAEYIHKKNESGLLVDQILRFHQIHGAKIQKVLPGYRPKDIENQGYGVLIEYDIHNRQRFDGVGVEKNQQEKVEIEEDVDEVVAGCVRTVMNKKCSFDSDRPLMEMGIESLELLELKYLLEKKLEVKIEPNFFFKYGTPKAIASYFKGETQAKHKNISELLPKIAQPEPKAEKTDSGFSAAQLENGIAIIGTACRFPGDADSPQKYWSLLCNGIDAITEVPLNRWDIEKYYNPDKNQPGKISSRYGGFISEVDKFDADFFHISPREAKYIDPQQRILLEENWKALENAGINPESLSGTETGVFVGIAFHDYEQLQNKHNQEQDLNLYFATGSSNAIGAGRLSYFLKLNGPAITVDTACSSSLSAVHLACQSIRNGECELALASGVNLLLSPELSISFSQAGMLSPDGRCKTFDASANGYVRSEGCGVVVLKSLKQAIEDRDPILAVVRGTAINQDGASNGMTAPNQSAQEAVIQKALSIAGISANQVSYVEAHGTGTSLGDPVEIKALEVVYGNNRGSERPLTIGSVKTNIGHTEAAAGIAGLIKVVLSLQNKYIPPHLHLKELNPYMSLTGIPGVIPMEGKLWEKYDGDESCVGAVSSFGFSGTNAHVILEEVPTQVKTQQLEEQPHLLTLSAKTEKALDELVSHYQNYLETNRELELADVCYTANTGRAQFNHRLGVIASNPQELTKKLLQHKAGEEVVGVFSGKLSSDSSYPKLAFLFTGQGSQYVNMGRKLYETQPTFRQALEECNQILSSYLEHPLLEILYHQDAENSSSSLIDQTAYTQPALFAIEYSLFKLWESWGIKPNVVMGHSVGEYVAACVAGVFSLEDGLKLIAMRGRLMQKLPSGGEMVSVMASESQVTEAVGEYSSQVTIAAINGPKSIVISGESGAIATICSKLEAVGVKTKQLQVSHAFHSPLMEPMLAEFAAVAKEVTYSQPKIPLISNVTGEKVGAEITIPEYWTRHVREPVRFAQSMKTLHQQGYKIFLEIGPKPILFGMGRQCLPESEGEWLPSLRPGVDEWQQILLSLGQLYVRGAKIDWLGFDQDYACQKVELPTYPFQRERYWIETAQTKNHQFESSCNVYSVPKIDFPLQIFCLSASSQQELLHLAKNTILSIEQHPEVKLSELCFLVNTKQSLSEYRLAVIAQSTLEVLAKLTDFVAGKDVENLWNDRIKNSDFLKVGFIFSPYSTFYPNMGKELYETQPKFRQSIDQCHKIISDYTGQSLLELLYSNKVDNLSEIKHIYRLPMLFAIQYALSELWKSWGVEPSLVMGHSFGEYSAALIAEIFNLEEGLKLLVSIGKLWDSKLEINCQAIGIIASEKYVEETIEPYIQEIKIISYGGYRNTVVGDPQTIQLVAEKLRKEGVLVKELPFAEGYHTDRIKPILGLVDQIHQGVNYSSSKIPFVSAISGELLNEEVDSTYWRKVWGEPVKFSTAIETAYKQGCKIFIEIGPKAVTLSMGRSHLGEEAGIWLSSLREQYSNWQIMLQSLSQLYVLGMPINWYEFYQNYPQYQVKLPIIFLPEETELLEKEKQENISKDSSFITSIETRINQMLIDGNVEYLTQHLKEKNELSEIESKFIPKLLELIAKTHQKEIIENQVKDYFYQLLWQPLIPNEDNSAIQLSHWLIFADSTGVGKKLATKLKEQGHKCTLVYRGKSFKNPESGTYLLNPCNFDEFEKLCQEIITSKQLSCQRVIHLWSLDAPTSENLSISQLEQVQIWGCGSLLYLLQSLVKISISSSPQLWIVTRGSQPVLSKIEELTVATSPLWGLGRVISLEHPQLWGGLIDLDLQGSQNEIETLVEILTSNQIEDHLALREKQIYVARLFKQCPKLSAPISFSSNATYLITGGLGALGLHVAKWMVSKGAKYLVLISRSSLSEDKQKYLSDLKQLGAEVVTVQADVCNPEEMLKVLDKIDSYMFTLKGIIHAAGKQRSERIERMQVEQLLAVMSPKIIGGWILHQITKDRELDFFVSFSSIASVWGAVGQAHYSAGNHFLDVLSSYRQAQGLPSFTVNWGPWSGGGMASEEFLRELKEKGIESLSPQQGIAALELLWNSHSVQTTVVNVNWDLFKQLYSTGRQRLLLEEINVKQVETKRSTSKQKLEIIKKMETAPKTERRNLLITYLQKEIGKILGLKIDQLPSLEQGFFEMGMDSLMAVELKNRLEDSLNCSLPTTLIFNFSNVISLADHIASSILGWELENIERSEFSKAESNKIQELSEVEELSEESIQLSIATKLTKLETLLEEN